MKLKRIKIGEKYKMPIIMNVGYESLQPVYEGVVKYIHPERNFANLEFQLKGGKIIQSYIIMNDGIAEWLTV